MNLPIHVSWCCMVISIRKTPVCSVTDLSIETLVKTNYLTYSSTRCLQWTHTQLFCDKKFWNKIKYFSFHLCSKLSVDSMKLWQVNNSKHQYLLTCACAHLLTCACAHLLTCATLKLPTILFLIIRTSFCSISNFFFHSVLKQLLCGAMVKFTLPSEVYLYAKESEFRSSVKF